jgi:3-dehydroquinate synthase
MVASSSGAYRISIGAGGLQRAVAEATIVVVDESLTHLLPPEGTAYLSIPATEATKTLAGVEQLALSMRRLGVDRSSRLCAIGGGSIQDVATLTSALYMRGIPWTYVPSTLLAMADSCIGGKSAINAGGYKNLLGSFYPPGHVHIDPALATTQPTAELIGGVAEAVKICFAAGPDDFVRFVDLVSASRELTADAIEDIATLALTSKKRIVEADEFDTAERQLLNFGHTFSHALEAASSMILSHGLGVALGMRAALALPFAGRTSLTQRLDQYSQELLERALATGWRLPALDWRRFEEAFNSDKKHTPRHYRMVLPNASGRLEVVARDRTKEALAEAVAAAQNALEDVQ